MQFTKANPKMDLTIVQAMGSILFDNRGNSYIDFVSGRGTANLGHCHPLVVESIKKQAGLMMHFTNEIRMPVQEEYVERLGEILPEYDTVFLTNSGTEAVEAAIKLSRLHTGRTEIISFDSGFHGRTMGSLSATYDEAIRQPFYPLVPDFKICAPEINSVRQSISPNTAAIIIEPIQGAGGVNIFPKGFLDELRTITRENGAMLVFDECQTGFGRTGRYFAAQKTGIMPDILVASKSMCGGFPVGGIFTTGIDFPENMHGGTFYGNPLACAAGLGVLDAFREEKILEKVQERESLIYRIGNQLREKPYIKDFRFSGLMIGLEFDEHRIPAKSLKSFCLENGLLINIVRKNVIRILPALNIDMHDLERGFQIILEGLRSLDEYPDSKEHEYRALRR